MECDTTNLRADVTFDQFKQFSWRYMQHFSR